MPRMSLAVFVRSLKSDCKHSPSRPDEEWDDLIGRISTPGQICDVEEGTYIWFLEATPPVFVHVGMFASFCTDRSLRFFWCHIDGHAVRQLTFDETRQFCNLAGIRFP